jgi:hypothetical protein
MMVPEEKQEQPIGKSDLPNNLVEFFRQSSLMGLDLDLERDRSPGRNINLDAAEDA